MSYRDLVKAFTTIIRADKEWQRKLTEDLKRPIGDFMHPSDKEFCKSVEVENKQKIKGKT